MAWRRALRAGLASLVFPALFYCASGGAAPEPSLSRRAVLVSFDGVAGDRLTRLLEDPSKLTAGGYRRIAARGLIAGGSVPPTPSLTAVSHITHVTGALPQDTGIVSNWMLDPGKSFGATISGFDAPIRAETLWEAARRQGKRVGVMLYPGADGKSPARSADWAMIWPGDTGLSSPRLRVVGSGEWGISADHRALASFSPARALSLVFPKTAHAVGFFALDSTDDRTVNYDRLLVEPPGGGGFEVRPGDWFPVEVPDEKGRTGAWCKLLSLPADLSKAEIYTGSLHRSAGYPADFVRRLDSELGFWPGPPDGNAFGADSGRSEEFLEQAARLASFLTRADLLAMARPDWDLLLFYQPQVDEVGHEFLLADARQPGYTPEGAARFQKIVDRSYALADRSLDAIEKTLSPGDSIFVTSDHGMTPIWGEIQPNQVLHRAGFVRLSPDGRIDPSSVAVAVVSGGIAHIHLNKSARPDALVRIETLFRDFRVAGASPWDTIVRREDAGPLGLKARESGDLIVLAKPGFVFSRGAREGGETAGPANHAGAHGYRNVYPDVYASFLAAGPGISPGRISTINSWEIAARVATAIGMEPPRQAARPRAAP